MRFLYSITSGCKSTTVRPRKSPSESCRAETGSSRGEGAHHEVSEWNNRWPRRVPPDQRALGNRRGRGRVAERCLRTGLILFGALGGLERLVEAPHRPHGGHWAWAGGGSRDQDSVLGWLESWRGSGRRNASIEYEACIVPEGVLADADCAWSHIAAHGVVTVGRCKTWLRWKRVLRETALRQGSHGRRSALACVLPELGSRPRELKQ